MAEKLCTLEEWRKVYYSERYKKFIKNNLFSRMRAFSKHPVEIVRRGKWSKSNLFSICESCGKMSFYGMCQFCGYMIQCCFCKRIKMPDGTYQKAEYPIKSKNISHGYCKPCFDIVMRKIKHGNN